MAAQERPTRDRLLDAFETLLVSAGSRAATLDAVAAEAQVSKGGLLYHFHSKDELVDGMLSRSRVSMPSTRCAPRRKAPSTST